jgi:hypothetical protein
MDDQDQPVYEEEEARPEQKQHETYKKISLLGKGSFGKAFLVECGSD